MIGIRDQTTVSEGSFRDLGRIGRTPPQADPELLCTHGRRAAGGAPPTETRPCRQRQRTPTYPRTREPANPRIHESVNPRARQPVNPRTRESAKSPLPGLVCKFPCLLFRRRVSMDTIEKGRRVQRRERRRSECSAFSEMHRQADVVFRSSLNRGFANRGFRNRGNVPYAHAKTCVQASRVFASRSSICQVSRTPQFPKPLLREPQVFATKAAVASPTLKTARRSSTQRAQLSSTCVLCFSFIFIMSFF